MSSGSSRRWLQRQQRDTYVRDAQASGYRSRAAYKLLELDARHHLLRPGLAVLDLGAAPGGFSQVIRERVGAAGNVVACDLVPVELAGVDSVVGDARDTDVQRRIAGLLPARGADLVISDMAPNFSGVRVRDQAVAMELAELALDVALALMCRGGALVVKLFHGDGTDAFVAGLRQYFGTVKRVKPAASREESREAYVVCTRFNGRRRPPEVV